VVLAALAILGGTFHGEGACQGGASEEIRSWGDSLSLDQRVLTELGRFPAEEQVEEELLLEFAREIRSRVFQGIESFSGSLASGGCEASIDVRIGDLDFSDLEERVGEDAFSNEAWEKFLKSLIRTEMIVCLETAYTPSEILQHYISPEFRMKSQSRIVEMWSDSVGSCMETKGAYGLVDPTRICNRTKEIHSEDLAAQHSQVVFNEGEGPFQAVYFKESLKSFVRFPGGVALHYINYTRAANLGRLERWIGSGKIEDSQKDTVEELHRWLRGEGRPGS